MKTVLTILFAFFCSAVFAQASDTTTVQQTVKLTEWQEKQLIAFDQQRKQLEEQSKLLWLAILDANKVDPNKVVKVDTKPGELIIKLRKEK